MSDFLNKLTAYGADVNGAMSRLLDDEELYSSCVDSFVMTKPLYCLAKLFHKKIILRLLTTHIHSKVFRQIWVLHLFTMQ